MSLPALLGEVQQSTATRKIVPEIFVLLVLSLRLRDSSELQLFCAVAACFPEK